MLKLTKFSGEKISLNPDLIKSAEGVGDTLITLISGEKLLIRETPEIVERLFIQYKKKCHSSAEDLQPLLTTINSD